MKLNVILSALVLSLVTIGCTSTQEDFIPAQVGIDFAFGMSDHLSHTQNKIYELLRTLENNDGSVETQAKIETLCGEILQRVGELKDTSTLSGNEIQKFVEGVKSGQYTYENLRYTE